MGSRQAYSCAVRGSGRRLGLAPAAIVLCAATRLSLAQTAAAADPVAAGANEAAEKSADLPKDPPSAAADSTQGAESAAGDQQVSASAPESSEGEPTGGDSAIESAPDAQAPSPEGADAGADSEQGAGAAVADGSASPTEASLSSWQPIYTKEGASPEDYELAPSDPKPLKRRQNDKSSIRWSSVGALFGTVVRPSSSPAIRYRPGIVYGGYFRPEIISWLGINLYYRKELIPVELEPGAFNSEDQTPTLDFTQPDLDVTSMGFRIEPAWVIRPRLRILGVVSWSWLRFVAEMPHAPGFDLRADRAAVEMNWGFGGGASLDIVENWIELTVSGTYNFVASQSGDAYEPIQGVYEGKKVQLGPLPRFKNAGEVLVQLGLIL